MASIILLEECFSWSVNILHHKNQGSNSKSLKIYGPKCKKIKHNYFSITSYWNKNAMNFSRPLKDKKTLKNYKSSLKKS